MGYFDKPNEMPGALAPLTRERVVDFMNREDYRFRLDDDGDSVFGIWDGNGFYFMLLGEKKEIMQVRGKWTGRLPQERARDVLLAVNEWNRERIWPKVYTAVDDEGMVGVFVETSTDLEHGVTDDQLSQLLRCGLGTGFQVFDHFRETFPDAVFPEPDAD